MLGQLSELGHLLPRYTGPRCLLERHAVGGCDLCRDACPHEAVGLKPMGLGIEIDPERCTGCGLCVQSCPTGALEYDLLPTLQGIQDQRPAEGRVGAEATLTCSQSGAGGPSVPCLGRVTPGVVANASAWGVPLTLLHGDCAGCAVGGPEVPERLGTVLAQAAELREGCPGEPTVGVRAARPEDLGQRHGVNRRGALAALLRSGAAQVGRAIPERPLPFVDWSEPAQRTPAEWRYRRVAQRPPPPPGLGVVWPAPVVDDSCIDCPVCANVCPTQAITRDLTPEGGVRLLLDLAACTGCLACLRSCPPQAIHEQREWLPQAFDQPLLLRESDTVM